MELTIALPSGPTVWERTIFAARQSPFGMPRLMTGISRSDTSDVTTRPSAAPVITPTASASAFCFSRKSRNSRYTPCLLLLFFDRDDRLLSLGLLVQRHFPEHLGADGQDEREAVVALHPADRDADEHAALVEHA